MAEITSQSLSEDRKRREKIRKMIEAMDSEKLAMIQDFIVNQKGPGQYSVTGDYDPVEVEGFDIGSGAVGVNAYAQDLIDEANESNKLPPHQFWFEGRMYTLNFTMEDVSVPAKAPKPKPGAGAKPRPQPGGPGLAAEKEAVFVSTDEIVF